MFCSVCSLYHRELGFATHRVNHLQNKEGGGGEKVVSNLQAFDHESRVYSTPPPRLLDRGGKKCTYISMTLSSRLNDDNNNNNNVTILMRSTILSATRYPITSTCVRACACVCVCVSARARASGKAVCVVLRWSLISCFLY